MIFENYLKKFELLKNSHGREISPNTFMNDLQKGMYKPTTKYFNEGKEEIYQKDLLPEFDYSELINLFGTPPYMITRPKIGEHPDFNYLGTNEKEYHYAVSMFTDIKGSTVLGKKYGFDLEKVRLLKDTILTLSIYICNFFGGHIQRLQGDGVFVYFVSKEQNPKDAVISALNATSMLNYFIRYELPKVFEDIDVEPLKIRTGIDYGNNEQVLWSRYGIPACNELTTTSTHTDLAAKLQSKSSANGIMIGDNVKSILDLNENLVSYQDQLLGYYKYYEFKWENYFSTFGFIKRKQGKSLEMVNNTFSLDCFILDENGNSKKYSQNLYSIPKGFSMSFKILRNGVEYVPRTMDEIEWTIYNTGKEAGEDLVLRQNRLKNSGTLNDITSKYLGHHFVECKLKRRDNEEIILKYYAFVQ